MRDVFSYMNEKKRDIRVNMDNKDVDASLTGMRKLLEIMVNEYLDKNEIEMPQESTLVDKIIALKDQKVITEESANNMLYVRRLGNIGAHDTKKEVSVQTVEHVYQVLLREDMIFRDYMGYIPPEAKIPKNHYLSLFTYGISSKIVQILNQFFCLPPDTNLITEALTDKEKQVDGKITRYEGKTSLYGVKDMLTLVYEIEERELSPDRSIIRESIKAICAGKEIVKYRYFYDLKMWKEEILFHENWYDNPSRRTMAVMELLRVKFSDEYPREFQIQSIPDGKLHIIICSLYATAGTVLYGKNIQFKLKDDGICDAVIYNKPLKYDFYDRVALRYVSQDALISGKAIYYQEMQSALVFALSMECKKHDGKLEEIPYPVFSSENLNGKKIPTVKFPDMGVRVGFEYLGEEDQYLHLYIQSSNSPEETEKIYKADCNFMDVKPIADGCPATSLHIDYTQMCYDIARILKTGYIAANAKYTTYITLIWNNYPARDALYWTKIDSRTDPYDVNRPIDMYCMIDFWKRTLDFKGKQRPKETLYAGLVNGGAVFFLWLILPIKLGFIAGIFFIWYMIALVAAIERQQNNPEK